MKKIVKKIVPENIISQVRNYYNRNYKLKKMYNFDRKRYANSSYELSNNRSLENLRSKITFHYHSIEKGLSNANFRLGFGKKAFDQLFLAMDKFLELGYPATDTRFQQAISVIEEYVILHRKNNFDAIEAENKLSEYKELLLEENCGIGGYSVVKREELPNFNSTSFKNLAAQRYSIRDFGNDEINDDDIFDAIKSAIKTPSVCNRQAWKVHYIKEKSLLEKALVIQGGLRGNGKNLNRLMLVTCNKEYMNGPHERNQTFIDGGMFTMSLIYALTSKQIATCALNADFSLEKEQQIRDIMKLQSSEDLIAFVALGSYPGEMKVAKSPRDSVDTITKVYC